MKITPHFDTDEAKCIHCGQLPDIVLPNIKDMCEIVLEPMREFLSTKLGQDTPIHRTSWYRCDIYNFLINGGKAHPTGNAIDFVVGWLRIIDNNHRYLIAQFIFDNKLLTRMEFGKNPNGNCWIHLDRCLDLPQEQIII